MIPKVFHLTAKSKVLPPYFQKNVDRIAELYPDFEIKIHDDADIERFIKSVDRSYYEDVIKMMPKYIMVVDTVRYMWMYHLGGIYCDMDIFFQKRIEFAQEPMFISREWTWPSDPSITDSVHNCIFASPKGHPAWKHILDGIASNVAATGTPGIPSLRHRVRDALVRLRLRAPAEPAYSPVFNMTGPNAISKILTDQSLLDRYPEITVCPPNLIYQEGMSRGNLADASVVHETAASWKSIG